MRYNVVKNAGNILENSKILIKNPENYKGSVADIANILRIKTTGRIISKMILNQKRQVKVLRLHIKTVLQRSIFMMNIL